MATGKLVDTWYYTCPDVTPATNVDPDHPRPTPVKSAKVPIQVRIVKNFHDDGPPQSPRSVVFELSAQTPEIQLSGTDIDALRAALWDKLDAHYAIRWEAWYLVDLIKESPYDGSGTGLTFQYQRVEKGLAWDGTVLMRQHRHTAREQVSFWPNEFRNDRGRLIACIPGTPTNDAALEEFTRCIDELRKRLGQFLTPTTIQDTLLNLGSNPLLPHPDSHPTD